MSDSAEVVIEVDAVSRVYGQGAAAVHAVQDVSFRIMAGESSANGMIHTRFATV